MRILFHFPRQMLADALSQLKSYEDRYGQLDSLADMLEAILEDDKKVPKPNPGWPVSYEDACDVVSALHDQLDDAYTQISLLEKQLLDVKHGELDDYLEGAAPDNNGERPVPEDR